MYNHFYLDNIKYVDLGIKSDKTWTDVRSICDNFSDGGYTLPVPDSQEYHDALVALAGRNDVALGFSDKKEEGNWTNVYTGKISIIKLLLIIIFQGNP